nr:MAG: hypothetical protein 1 [Leviviridae sp.]
MALPVREFTRTGYYGYVNGLQAHSIYGDLYQMKGLLSIGYEGHWGYPRFPPDSDIGGGFRLEKNDRVLNPVHVGTIRGQTPSDTYVGSFSANSSMSQFGIGRHEPIDWGAAAYNRMKPTQPDFSGLNALYELKDIPEMLRQRFRGLKDIPNYWLALKFGWEPLLRDVRNFVNLQRNAQDRLQQLLRDNGRPVRRRITMQNREVNNVSTAGSGYGAVYPTLVTQFYAKTPVFLDRVVTTDRVWASGTYKYWLPSGPRDINWTRGMVARIFGLQPSPSVVYNAIPWTWLVDWFTGLGDVIENTEAGVADRLAASNFYIMREYRETATREATMWFKRVSGEEVSFTSSCVVTRKSCERARGNPFGLAAPNPLSGMQLSILGALGLSRI